MNTKFIACDDRKWFYFRSVPTEKTRCDRSSRMYRNVQKQTSSERTEIIESLQESNPDTLFHLSICPSLFQPAFVAAALLFPHPLQIPFCSLSQVNSKNSLLVYLSHHPARHIPLLFFGTHRSQEPFIFVCLSLLVLLQIKPVTLILLLSFPPSLLIPSSLRRGEKRDKEDGQTIAMICVGVWMRWGKKVLWQQELLRHYRRKLQKPNVS